MSNVSESASEVMSSDTEPNYLEALNFEATLKNPKLMPKTLDQWCEALLHPQRRVWASLTEADQSEWTFQASVSYETGSNENLWPQ